MPISNDASRTKTEELTPAQMALARHRTYALLGQLYLEGVTAVTLSTLQSIPELARTLPNTFDADEAAAEHQTLFGFNVFPYESIFLGKNGLLGGTATDAILASYRQAGFPFGDNSASADHIGHEVGLLAHLCGAEADALEDNLPLAAERMRDLQRDFLQNHLLHWLLPFVLAVKGQERPFYAALAELTLEFINQHTQDWRGFVQPKVANLAGLPAAPSLLDNDKTGLKEIATYLTTPPYSGFFLSRDDIAQLARSQDIPRGFGDRTQMLTNLLRGAAQFETLPALLDALQTKAVDWQEAYAASANDKPALAPFISPWQEHAAQTGHMLAQIEQQIKAAS